MGNYYITTQIELPFAQALPETRRALAGQDFLIITEIDLQKARFGTLGQQTRPHTLLDVCVRSWDYRALKREREIALLMSSLVRLQENTDGNCTLATADFKHLYQDSDNGLELIKAARAVEARLRAVVESVRHAEAIHTPITV